MPRRPEDNRGETTDTEVTDLSVLGGADSELSSDVLDILGQAASEESGRLAKIGVDWISIQGGEFSFDDRQLRDPLAMIIADFSYDNAWYEQTFDPKNPTSPACFALSRDPEELRPHDAAKIPQGDENGACKTCVQNAFGSRGKGKACKNSIRLALVPPDTMIKGDPQVYQLRLPPTAMKPFLQYVRNVNGAMNRPLWSVVTDLTMVKKGTYSIPVPKLNMDVNDKEVLLAIKAFREKLGDAVLDASSYLIDREAEDERRQEATNRSKVQ